MKKYIVCCIIRNAFNVYVREGESDGDGEQWTILVSSAINRKKISSELMMAFKKTIFASLGMVFIYSMLL